MNNINRNVCHRFWPHSHPQCSAAKEPQWKQRRAWTQLYVKSLRLVVRHRVLPFYRQRVCVELCRALYRTWRLRACHTRGIRWPKCRPSFHRAIQSSSCARFLRRDAGVGLCLKMKLIVKRRSFGWKCLLLLTWYWVRIFIRIFRNQSVFNVTSSHAMCAKQN